MNVFCLQRSDKYDIQMDGTEHRLIIKDVDGRDAGEYSAQYKNLETTANLIVEGKIL